jgi:hypothetical protein
LFVLTNPAKPVTTGRSHKSFHIPEYGFAFPGIMGLPQGIPGWVGGWKCSTIPPGEHETQRSHFSNGSEIPLEYKSHQFTANSQQGGKK